MRSGSSGWLMYSTTFVTRPLWSEMHVSDLVWPDYMASESRTNNLPKFSASKNVGIVHDFKKVFVT